MIKRIKKAAFFVAIFNLVACLFNVYIVSNGNGTWLNVAVIPLAALTAIWQYCIFYSKPKFEPVQSQEREQPEPYSWRESV